MRDIRTWSGAGALGVPKIEPVESARPCRAMKPVSNDHPLSQLFADHVRESVAGRRLAGCTEIESYLTDLLVRFVHTDGVFAIRREGEPLNSVIEMLAEGDVRLNADSFERERQVHRHIGDYILFWSGVYPDFLRRLRVSGSNDLVCDYTRQGSHSYYVVSTFDYPPFGEEAPTFRRLSEEFEGYTAALADVAASLPIYAA